MNTESENLNLHDRFLTYTCDAKLFKGRGWWMYRNIWWILHFAAVFGACVNKLSCMCYYTLVNDDYQVFIVKEVHEIVWISNKCMQLLFHLQGVKVEAMKAHKFHDFGFTCTLLIAEINFLVYNILLFFLRYILAAEM
jgi:hypothetical protein